MVATVPVRVPVEVTEDPTAERSIDDETVTLMGAARVKLPVAERIPPPRVIGPEPVPRLTPDPADRTPAEMRVPPV